jgi:hypothetical protein
MKWSLAPLRDGKSYGLQLLTSSPSPAASSSAPLSPSLSLSRTSLSHSLSPLQRVIFLDNALRPCCEKYWIEGAMKIEDTFDINSSSLRSSLASVNFRVCSNPLCTLSHSLPLIPAHLIRSFSAHISLQSTLLAMTHLFDDEYMWKKQPYIEHLFTALADQREVEERHDPMTRENEVRRVVTHGKERLALSASLIIFPRQLDYDAFLELMTICEEDFSGAKPFRRQFLFHRVRLEKIAPTLMKEHAMLSLLSKLFLLVFS